MKDSELKSKNDTSRAISNDVSTKQNNNTSDFVDNRPEAVMARQLQQMADNSPQSKEAQKLQGVADNDPKALKNQALQNNLPNSEAPQKNNTGLPDELKAGIENTSGLSLNDIKVNYNSDKPAKVGAYAYAEYPNIYVAAGQEKYLAEEAWHLVQQMKGQVQKTEMVNGKAVDGTTSRENEAKKQGDKATKTPINNNQELQTKKGAGGIIQRAKVEKKSHYGSFSVDDSKYKFINSDTELDLDLDFEPTVNADATKVGLVQLVKKKMSGNVNAIDPNAASKMSAEGHRIDQISDNRNPLYATGSVEPLADADKLESYATPDGQHAIKDADPLKGWTQNANIKDAPSVFGGNNSSIEFETSAIALEGNEKGEYYGSVKWGWERDGSGTLSVIPFDLVSMGVPSKNFMGAAEKWNDGKTRGTLVVKNNATKVTDATLVEQFKLQKGDEVEQKKTLGSATQSYVSVKVKTSSADPSLVGKTGVITVGELEDKGDGKDTVDLPIVKTKIPTEADISLYKDKGKVTEDKKLPQKTRMKVLSEDSDMIEIEIVDGADIKKKGWVEKSKIKDE